MLKDELATREWLIEFIEGFTGIYEDAFYEFTTCNLIKLAIEFNIKFNA
jgi:hypothetical protein